MLRKPFSMQSMTAILGANPKARAAFSHQLKDTEGYEIESVLAGTDGWNPIANGNALVNIKR